MATEVLPRSGAAVHADTGGGHPALHRRERFVDVIRAGSWIAILTGKAVVRFTVPTVGEFCGVIPSLVEQHYQSRMDLLSSKDRVARCAAMLQWTRELLGRQLILERGPMSLERLKWEVAKRMYGADPASRAMIDQKLAHVSG